MVDKKHYLQILPSPHVLCSSVLLLLFQRHTARGPSPRGALQLYQAPPQGLYTLNCCGKGDPALPATRTGVTLSEQQSKAVRKGVGGRRGGEAEHGDSPASREFSSTTSVTHNAPDLLSESFSCPLSRAQEAAKGHSNPR